MFDGLHHLLLLRVDGLPLAFPVTFVACDVKQVFVGIDVFSAHKLRGIGYHLLGNAYLAGYLYGEAAARVAYLQLEECGHLLAVVEHGTVHHSLRVLGKVLEVLVVRRDDAKGTFLHEALQYGFRNGAADSWLRASAELIY